MPLAARQPPRLAGPPGRSSPFLRKAGSRSKFFKSGRSWKPAAGWGASNAERMMHPPLQILAASSSLRPYRIAGHLPAEPGHALTIDDDHGGPQCRARQVDEQRPVPGQCACPVRKAQCRPPAARFAGPKGPSCVRRWRSPARAHEGPWHPGRSTCPCLFAGLHRRSCLKASDRRGRPFRKNPGRDPHQKACKEGRVHRS